MTSNTTNRTDSSFRNLLRGAIIGAEGSEQVGFPASGRSGVSVTSIQIDLAGNPHVRRPFIDAAIKKRGDREPGGGRAPVLDPIRP